jgi:hypothetical protein
MIKGAEKSSPCMLSRHVVHLGILKWTRTRKPSSNNKTLNARLLARHKFVTGATLLQLEGAQSFNFEVRLTKV